MKVKFYSYLEGVGLGNLMFPTVHPMKGGKFPSDHPVGGEFASHDDCQCGDSEGMSKFRGLGYWASCFPEGDGICFKPLNGQASEQTIQDVKDCFGWEVKSVRT